MTPKTCKSGTDRIAFVALNFLKSYDVFVNVQGDEPLIDPKLIDELVRMLKKDKKVEYVTAAFPVKDEASMNSPNVVKVVFDKDMYAMYFSRVPIPFNRNGANIKYYKHIGIYGYKRKFLLEFTKIKVSSLEKAESLEQLRALTSGRKIKVVIAKRDSLGVDVPEDILKVEKYLYHGK
jgi:3-deoxy-manno-octulosonate cytidylyltransferase (CMP-KDO synthetase)